MPQATNAQMQAYADVRIRPRAEAARLLVAEIRDDKLAIDDEYARASAGAAWADARTDGPPHLLQAGGGANPDDFLNYNAFASALLAILDGTGNDAANAAALRGAWPVLQRASREPLT